MALDAYLEIFNIIMSIKKSKICSFEELESKLNEKGFKIEKNTPNFTIDEVAKNNYIAYVTKNIWRNKMKGADGSIYIFSINESYDKNLRMPQFGWSDGDEVSFSPYVLDCIEGLHFYDYTSEGYKEYRKHGYGMGRVETKTPGQSSVFELSKEQLKNSIPRKYISEFWSGGSDNLHHVVGGDNVYVFTYSQFIDAIKDLYLINWIKRNPFSLEK